MDDDAEEIMKRIKEKEETLRKLKMVQLHRKKVSYSLITVARRMLPTFEHLVCFNSTTAINLRR